ncbi:hypothetical protein LV84_00553 [Algoriphagus ratkowskyi]|uniref:Uncharacterized protein n=1 Tax=Algoriphagus ratkowskyi TaxID=57028 RepID=A0A2W7RJ58_9BACT|nr:hypothetical protein LV84_00553 [Algoriphagus ratkowskyi]
MVIHDLTTSWFSVLRISELMIPKGSNSDYLVRRGGAPYEMRGAK